jgi:hypothetical protein
VFGLVVAAVLAAVSVAAGLLYPPLLAMAAALLGLVAFGLRERRRPRE